ncbi:MAG: 4Fe-4S dicluster domain-containing protein [Nitrospinota bacterium]|nr:4Fe-4S dicluster domain-containing protein [Nitrospinota bacterium]
MSRIEYDVLFVGGGPASLSAAHRLVDLSLKNGGKIKIAILEKGKDFGNHSLSGAVSNPRSIKKLFPDYKEQGFPVEGVCSSSYLTLLGLKRSWNIPSPFSPPEMNKKGYLILSLSNVTSWMALKLEEKVKDNTDVIVDLYRGFPATEVVYEGEKIVGVQVDNTGNPEKDNCYAGVTVFGDRGFLSKDIIKKFNLANSSQTWAVGVKEVWDVANDYSGKVWHTLGYPLLDGTFGGGFIYGLSDKKLAIGLVAGLDSENPSLRPPQLLQNLKKHPMIQKMLKGGKISRYGASVIPEAGYYALPSKFALDGAMIIGDALGVMDIKGFSGVDKAMESGMTAAEVLYDAVQKRDYSGATLGNFKIKLMSESWVGPELNRSRYYRWTFHEMKELLSDILPSFLKRMDSVGPYLGGILTLLGDPGIAGKGLSALRLMNGMADKGEIKYAEDHIQNRADYKAKGEVEPGGYNKSTVYSTADIVFYAHTHYHEGNRHIDEFSVEVCRKCIGKFSASGNSVPCVGDCTAEVHEILDSGGEKSHHMNLENCVQCRTCEIVCPEQNLRVNPALHGSGPDFNGL